MRDFVGMESIDETTKDAVLNFSYYLAIGNMDEAYRSVKTIESKNVWENMATMCIKTR
jgi:intraflagellar transport protein 140